MKKNLIISPVGDNNFVRYWVGPNDNFDIILLYYSKDTLEYDKLMSENFKITKINGEKWHIIKNYLIENPNLIEEYETFWFPDDDLKIDNNYINELFNIHNEYKLSLSQPASIGHTSHKITRPQNFKLRYTNFVEVMCPIMSKNTLKLLFETFTITESGWGLDLLWPKLLGYPKDKIAIIDKIVIDHTKEVGKNYEGRFSRHPFEELNDIMRDHSVDFSFYEYKKIS
jgi:hypothetical protein